MVELPRTADVVVLGGGVNGASIAYHLARKKIGRVVLVEKRFLASGPTARSTAIVRRFYAMDLLSRMANAAADVFQNWREVVGGGDPGFHQVGYVILAGQENAPHLKRNAERAAALGSRVQLVSAQDVKALVPAIAADDIALASYEPESGYAEPASTTAAFVERARELGALIVQYTPVVEILTTGDKIAGVRTPQGELSAPAVVNCAGPWAARLLAPLGIEVEIRPIRHQMCVFVRPPEFPPHPVIVDTPNGTYMRPELRDLTIFGFGDYDEVVDPDRYDEGADAAEVTRDAELVVRRFPVMENGLARGGYSGVYDVTPDHQPILGAIPGYDGLYACFGWSGHGFKHAPVIGDVISDIVLDGRSEEYDLTPFRWSRFREGDLLPPARPITPCSAS
jgi:glycine/D-amino acid oxidase-like deaminating enzyme